MIVENELWWPTSSHRWRLNDHVRGAYDSLLTAIYTGCVKTIWCAPLVGLCEVDPLRFFEQDVVVEKAENVVEPVLNIVFDEVEDDVADAVRS